MKGNVTCSCGHSWNTSDSSKKDANVCHICGKDNTMKDGGWLDKYNDGGPVQPNYNDYSVSAGPDFEGDGYSNVGRNYSPAWGGQFKEGGNVPATKQDSLNLYNNAKQVLNYYNSKKYKKTNPDYNKLRNSGHFDPRIYSDDVNVANQAALEKFREINKIKTSSLGNITGGVKVPLSSGKSAEMTIPESMYYKKLDDNKYMQREIINSILDTRSPMQLFDKRIAPTIRSSYSNNNKQDDLYQDQVSLHLYDPILVKPESMLTPEERDFRIKTYGLGSVSTSKTTGPIVNSKLTSTSLSAKKPIQPVIYKKPEPTPQSTIDFMEGNYGQEPITEVPQQSAPSWGEVVDPRTGYTHMTRQGTLMYPLVGQRVPEMAMGGSIGGATQGIPGATGFMYARTGSIPSNGKYAKKTKASAQNGAEMKFYQEGLDFKPKSISRNGSVIKDDRGQWDHPGEITEIGSNQITMQGVPYPVLGISDTGDMQMMYPNQEYQYDGESVTEYPMMAQGGQLTKLDQLINFTNYNTKQPGGWLDKYQ